MTRGNVLHTARPHRPRPAYLLVCLLTVLLLPALLSCAPTLPQRSSPLTLPDQFSAPGTSPLPDRWWLSFDDPQLTQLIDQALTDNLTLLSTWDKLRQARATARKSGSSLSPDLSLSGSASTSRSEQNDITTTTEAFSLGLVASYELDLWGRVRSTSDAAALDAEAQALDLQAAAITLSAEVASTWYQLAEQQQQMRLLREQREVNEKVLQLIDTRVRTGKTGIADLLQQQHLLEASRGEESQLTASITLLEHQLALLLGKTPGHQVSAAAPELISLGPLPQTGLPATLIQRRPDILSTFTDVLAADKRVAAAIANTYPSISLTARLQTSGAQTSDLFNNWLASLLANLTAPLLDGGSRQAEVSRTRAVASEKVHIYGQTILQALVEVEDALVQEQQQYAHIASLQRQVDLAKQSITQISRRYRKGSVDYERVLSALLSYQNLQRSELSARKSLLLNRIDLCRALGGGWQLTEPPLPQSP